MSRAREYSNHRLREHRSVGLKLPLAHRIRDAGLEAALLLRLAHLEPVFDQLDAVIHDVQLELRADLEEAPVLRFRAEAQHILDTGPVVPAAVEDHDFASRGGVLEVALHIELGLLAVGGCRQRHHAEHAMADALGDRLDHAALAGGIAPLEDYDYPRALFLDPILQGAQLDLQRAQCLVVFFTFQASIGSCHCCLSETVSQSRSWFENLTTNGHFLIAKLGILTRSPCRRVEGLRTSRDTTLSDSGRRAVRFAEGICRFTMLYAPASTAVTALRKEADERIIIFSASTTRKKIRPPRKRRGQTQSGMASLSNKTCSGGA